jgi:hypothetical protein
VQEGDLMRRIFFVAFLASVCALIAGLWWPLATEMLHSGIPTELDDHRVSHYVYLTGFIFISAVFISLGIKNIGDRDGNH